jgi:hypothetical protein
MNWTYMFVWVLANERFNPWRTGLFAGHPGLDVTVRQRRRGRSYRSFAVVIEDGASICWSFSVVSRYTAGLVCETYLMLQLRA